MQVPRICQCHQRTWNPIIACKLQNFCSRSLQYNKSISYLGHFPHTCFKKWPKVVFQGLSNSKFPFASHFKTYLFWILVIHPFSQWLLKNYPPPEYSCLVIQVFLLFLILSKYKCLLNFIIFLVFMFPDFHSVFMFPNPQMPEEESFAVLVRIMADYRLVFKSSLLKSLSHTLETSHDFLVSKSLGIVVSSFILHSGTINVTYCQEPYKTYNTIYYPIMFKDERDVQTINGRAWFVYVPGINSCCQISHKHQIGRNDFLLIFADLVPRCKEAFIQKHEKCLHKNLLI